MNTKIIRYNDPDFDSGLEKAAHMIRDGKLVIFPTETVYGLGADATSAEASKKIFAAKGRPSDNPLIVHIAEPSDAEDYAYTSAEYYALAQKYMPGPLTVIMRSKESIPPETRGGLSTVAIRCPSHEVARKLIKLSQKPIAAPSANLSGSPSPTRASHVIDDMMGRVDAIIDGGDSDFGLESTIVKIEDDGSLILLRPGKITVDDLEKSFKVSIASAVTSELKSGEKAISPGMKYRHYAPKSPVVLLDGNIEKCIKYIFNQRQKRIAILTYEEEFKQLSDSLPNAELYLLGEKSDELTVAHRLFDILRSVDKKDFEIIYAPLPSREGIGLAIYNRLIRAAAHTIIKL